MHPVAAVSTEALGARGAGIGPPRRRGLRVGRTRDRPGGRSRAGRADHRHVSDIDLTTSARPDESAAVLGPIASAMWDVGRAFGTVAARVGGRLRRGDDLSAGRVRAVVAEARGGVRGHARRRPASTRLHRQRDRRPPAVPRDRGPHRRHRGDPRAAPPPPPSPAVESFDEDPLRMLRAARFTSQLGFALDDEGRRAMTALAPRIDVVSQERIREELVKLIGHRCPRARVRAARGHGARRARAARAAGPAADERRGSTGTRTSTSTASRCCSRPSTSSTGGSRASRRTWSSASRRCCTTSASRRPGGSRAAASSRSTTTTWSARSSRASG